VWIHTNRPCCTSQMAVTQQSHRQWMSRVTLLCIIIKIILAWLLVILMPNLEQQIDQCLNLLKQIITHDLLGVYLYGSAIIGGLQKYSDIDLFVVTNRSTTREEKKQLASSLLQISGVYMKSAKPPVELTIVVKSDVNPWHYPPQFDFQYGDWLRKEFESGNIEPWQSKVMPDLALQITQVLLSGKTLVGAAPNRLLPQVPYPDFIKAMAQELPSLMDSLEFDTRNVLLTLARMWYTLETDTIHSKPESAGWVISRLPNDYHLVLQRAKSICMGEKIEYWDDLNTLIKPCVNFMIDKINELISTNQLPENVNKAINMD